MTALIVTAMETYDKIMKYSDPRTENWFLMKTPFPTIAILSLYMLVVKCGPYLMKNRKAMELKYALIFYNFALVFISFYMFYQFLVHQWLNIYALWGCELVDYSNSPKASKILHVCWFFLMTKFIELADTIFFILRKKNNQITVLHVCHHGLLPFCWWIGARFAAGGLGTFHAMVNALVHTIMYTYYGLSAVGPSMQKYLWWKKYLTTLQILQFVVVLIHTSQVFFLKDCKYPLGFAVAMFCNGVVFLSLFVNFYIRSYKLPKTKAANGVHTKGVVSNGNCTRNNTNGKIQNGIQHKKEQ